MALNPDTASWEHVRERLFCELVTDKIRASLPADAVIQSIAGQFDVHFAAHCFEVEDLEVRHQAVELRSEFTITRGHLRRWGVTKGELARAAGWSGGDVAVWDWPAVKTGVRLLRYPDKNTGWVNHVVSPGCLLEHADVPAPAIIMVPEATTALLAGLPDEEAQSLMLKLSLKLCRGKSPITKRPLIIDAKWRSWSVLPDRKNRFAEEYATAFGAL